MKITIQKFENGKTTQETTTNNEQNYTSGFYTVSPFFDKEYTTATDFFEDYDKANLFAKLRSDKKLVENGVRTSQQNKQWTTLQLEVSSDFKAENKEIIANAISKIQQDDFLHAVIVSNLQNENVLYVSYNNFGIKINNENNVEVSNAVKKMHKDSFLADLKFAISDAFLSANKSIEIYDFRNRATQETEDVQKNAQEIKKWLKNSREENLQKQLDLKSIFLHKTKNALKTVCLQKRDLQKQLKENKNSDTVVTRNLITKLKLQNEKKDELLANNALKIDSLEEIIRRKNELIAKNKNTQLRNKKVFDEVNQQRKEYKVLASDKPTHAGLDVFIARAEQDKKIHNTNRDDYNELSSKITEIQIQINKLKKASFDTDLELLTRNSESDRPTL